MAKDDKLRDGHGRYTRSPETAAREAQAARLRAQGKTYLQIAHELGYGSKSAAHDAVSRALHAIVADDAEALRRREAARLDGLYEEALGVLERTHYAHSHGKLVHDDEGRPLVDDGPKLAAIRELRAVRESYRRLYGLDAAQSSDVTIRQAPPATEAERQEQLDAVTAEFARRAAAGQPPDAETILTSEP
ncbi:hypothetical protein [Streptomyces sp. NPDC058045]|uniref:hypothetical protein n=1 Tax=Streptomyces sp. NPDC058045 TaxID=3346311 RepID=UPI0036F1702B